jgi:hypothetical protein
MKRSLTALLFIVFVFCSIGDAQRRRRKSTPARRSVPASNCPHTLRDINDCPDEGCGADFDANLNLRKNIRTDNQEPVTRTLRWMKGLEDPVSFKKGDTREELAALGEGQKITVVAFALVARKGSAESCNCKLTAAKDTDNHIVLVEAVTLKKIAKGKTKALAKKNTLALREEVSETAEFAPRVRLDHPKLVRANLQSRINAAPGNALLVRVTGLLMFDSEHFLGRPLHRENNWEIHPVMKLEFCERGNTCTARSDSGWKSLDDLP